MKVVINTCWGGFSLSPIAYEFLGIEWDGYGYKYSAESKRNDPKLVECVETLGPESGGKYGCLKVVEIPDDVKWKIGNYDGKEWVEEVHRTWD